MSPSSPVIALLLPFVLFGFSSASAQWSTDSISNTYVCTAAGIQSNPITCSDGHGGTFVAWEDARNADLDIYAQHLDANGKRIWQTNGLPICSAPGYQRLMAAAADGFGGLLLAWQDERTSQGDIDIYCQKIDSRGTIQWTANGVAVCKAKLNQRTPVIVADGKGGAIIAWRDDRTPYQSDVYAQHIDAKGAAKWRLNGVVVRAKAGSGAIPQMIRDGAGGTIVAWHQSDPTLPAQGVYAQRMDSTGAVRWIVDGLPLSRTHAQLAGLRIIEDGIGGAILAWAEPRGTSRSTIAAQRIDSKGNLKWAPEGVIVCDTPGSQRGAELATDLEGGAIIVWNDSREGNTNSDIYAQRVNAKGVRQWKSDGIPICAAPGYQSSQKIVSDGLGGAIVVWSDQRSTCCYQVYSQHVDRGGAPIWRTDGIRVSAKKGDQQSPAIAADGLGGAVIMWDYYASGDIYAQHLTGFGTMGDLALVTSVPLVPETDAAADRDTSLTIALTPILGALTY